MKQKTNQISIHRLRQEHTLAGVAPTSRHYRLEFQDDATSLYVQTDRESRPHWLEYVSPLLSSPARSIRNTSCSFVMFRKCADRIYALSGGYGHNALRGIAEEDFGIEVALRMIDEESSIAFIGQRSVKGTTRQLLRAVTGYNPSLDRENYNRILKALEGKAAFEGRRFRIKGRAALTLRTARSVEEIDAVLDEIAQILARDPHVTFPRSYDQITEESSVVQLDDQLASDFSQFWKGARSRDDMYLEFSDPFIQSRCDEFEFRFDRRVIRISDFDLGRARDGLIAEGARTPNSISDLGKIRASGINEHGHYEFDREPFARLLVYETSLPSGAACIRVSGRWYAVLDEIQSFLDSEIARIPVHRNLLPQWQRTTHPTELSYNQHAANLLDAACLDQQLVQLSNRSRVEVCDIFDRKTSRFIHIKATWGSKSCYLFSQGLVAGELYRQSTEFRGKCSENWPNLFTESIDGGEIIFGIAHPSAAAPDFPANLTYFAKVTLYDAARTLRSIGFRVALAPVDLIEA